MLIVEVGKEAWNLTNFLSCQYIYYNGTLGNIGCTMGNIHFPQVCGGQHKRFAYSTNCCLLRNICLPILDLKLASAGRE